MQLIYEIRHRLTCRSCTGVSVKTTRKQLARSSTVFSRRSLDESYHSLDGLCRRSSGRPGQLMCVRWFHDLGSSISSHAHPALSYLWLPCQDSKLAAAPCFTREHSDLDFEFWYKTSHVLVFCSNESCKKRAEAVILPTNQFTTEFCLLPACRELSSPS